MLPSSTRRVLLDGAYFAANLVLIYLSIALGPEVPDWQTFSALPDALAEGSVYEATANAAPFVWSPVMAIVMVGVVQIGYWPWVAAHIASVLALRDVRMITLTLGSWAFWFDTAGGNTLVFVFVLGLLALRGSQIAAVAYLATLVLMPRPLMLPLALWLLWQRPRLRSSFIVLFGVHAFAVVGLGGGMQWIEAMVTFRGPGWTVGPTAVLGVWWLLAGIPIAALLAWRGLLGWAGLAMSPYVQPQYFLWPLIDTEAGLGGATGDRSTRNLRGSRSQTLKGTAPAAASVVA